MTNLPPTEMQHSLRVGKSLYFFLFAAIGIFIPFLNVYYRENLNLSGAEIGLLGTLGPLIAIISAPLWGMLNDRIGRMRLLLSIVTIGAMLFAFLVGRMTNFVALMVMVAGFNLFVGAIMPLVDSFNLTLLGERREQYSNQRIWGTLGFLATSTFSGFLFGRIGLTYIFLAYILCLGAFLLSLMRLPRVQGEINRTVFQGLTQMMRQPVWIVLAISVILVMIANNSWINFLGIAIKQMGGSDALIGIAWSMGAFAELPIMWLGSASPGEIWPAEAGGDRFLLLRAADAAVRPDARTSMGDRRQQPAQHHFRTVLDRRGQLRQRDHPA